MLKRLTLLLALAAMLHGCRPETYTVRPRGYYRIDTPKHAYQRFDMPGYPYRFEFPTYGVILRDSSLLKMAPESPWWVNVDFPTLGGRVYMTYKRINAGQDFQKLLEDAHEMSFDAHSIRADYINSPSFINRHGVQGVMFDVGGNAASKYQFFATDSVKHFLRGALYFDVTPNADSLQPVTDFLKRDLDHMLGTLEWKE